MYVHVCMCMSVYVRVFVRKSVCLRIGDKTYTYVCILYTKCKIYCMLTLLWLHCICVSLISAHL